MLRLVLTIQMFHFCDWNSTSHCANVLLRVHVNYCTLKCLQFYLLAIQKDETKSQFVKQRTLCHTIAGNSVPILTITSKVSSWL